MRLLNSCRFKKFCSLLTVMLLMLFSVIPASAAELSTDEKAEVLVGTEYAIEIPSSMADNTVAISVDDIMEHSTVTTMVLLWKVHMNLKNMMQDCQDIHSRLYLIGKQQ